MEHRYLTKCKENNIHILVVFGKKCIKNGMKLRTAIFFNKFGISFYDST
jgi:hypothetical protein